MAKYIAALLLLTLVFASGCTASPRACTADAKQCPDGSYAVRNGSNHCEFNECPAVACNNCTPGNCPASCISNVSCNAFSYEDCPSSCVVCPPCEVCSSVSCQTEAFCAKMGFDRSWWATVSAGMMTQKKCEAAHGHWHDCSSLCNNTTPGKPCADICITYCECGGIAGFGCPQGFECTDYRPKGAADAMGICAPTAQ